ncbi:MAG: pyridoxamine 5'-phosphate oxidase [Deltaproteobacteria bacterium]|nr:MAG: pyridoxamine 5'-phosphate oxidase [Deltaproteobacteria bacterium]
MASERDVPDAMQVATLGQDGRPHLRTVLAKQVDEAGVVFYTNLNSRKGQDLKGDARIAATFHWKSLERQVHVEGRVRPVRSSEADAYFASRPRGSQIGAWASAQSQPVTSRELLERQVAEVSSRFEGREVPRPPHWSGFRIVPERWEFWQGRHDRLHDRFEFLPEGPGWTMRRLQP